MPDNRSLKELFIDMLRANDLMVRDEDDYIEIECSFPKETINKLGVLDKVLESELLKLKAQANTIWCYNIHLYDPDENDHYSCWADLRKGERVHPGYFARLDYYILFCVSHKLSGEFLVEGSGNEIFIEASPIQHMPPHEAITDDLIEEIVRISGGLGRIYKFHCLIGKKVKTIEIDIGTGKVYESNTFSVSHDLMNKLMDQYRYKTLRMPKHGSSMWFITRSATDSSFIRTGDWIAERLRSLIPQYWQLEKRGDLTDGKLIDQSGSWVSMSIEDRIGKFYMGPKQVSVLENWVEGEFVLLPNGHIQLTELKTIHECPAESPIEVDFSKHYPGS